ncbi:ImmA/IrrE family metallo-endopeptidase [Domibacillus indicus]|uniref:ImmA/IrrE family metallo-endopeptidase n=1 Tax=Domibacillus indicus TaxID=1437523 RepID=UPI0020423227|nr:ImmA/IrrE family metallo-endopeptidase [Domibacillus indicus]MCM3789469.1 ImmA/IrrE family metallo-endopeptidase [Domibacillus indicus]
MSDIKVTVQNLIKKHNTSDPFTIAEQNGILLSYEALGNILGYFSSYKRVNFIHINNKLNEHGQRFVCAHELGHALLHPKTNTSFLKRKTLFSIDRMEVEANTFAVELLLPDEKIKEYSNEHLTLYQIGEMHGVPREIVSLKTVESFF